MSNLAAGSLGRQGEETNAGSFFSGLEVPWLSMADLPPDSDLEARFTLRSERFEHAGFEDGGMGWLEPLDRRHKSGPYIARCLAAAE